MVTFQGEWLKRCDWDRHARMFRELVPLHSAVAMELHPHVAANMPGELWERWRCVIHPHVIGIVGSAMLSYAAIDWSFRPLSLSKGYENEHVVAKWGLELVDAYERMSAIGEVGWFASPKVFVDVFDRTRLAFEDPREKRKRIPPEDREVFPQVSPRGVVYIVGNALRQLVSRALPNSSVGAIILRCTVRDPEARFANLGDLRKALTSTWQYFTGLSIAERVEGNVAWGLIERAIGWMSVGDVAHAAPFVREELVLDPNGYETKQCAAELFYRLSVDKLTPDLLGQLARQSGFDVRVRRFEPMSSPNDVADVPDVSKPTLSWAEVAPRGAELEAARDFFTALGVYSTVKRDPETAAELDSAMARCNYALGKLDAAIAFASAAMANAPTRTDAIDIACRARIRVGQHAAALPDAERWLALHPNAATAHYLRGKSLLGLGRLAEARAAFERALAHEPSMVEAMLLRREVDRTAAQLRIDVGTANAELVLPPQLEVLRAVLGRGDFARAIEILGSAEHAGDVAAQVVLAGILSSLRRYDEAIVVCDRALAIAPDAGATLAKAYALLELNRPSEALVLFDLIPSGVPQNIEAAAGRARCLVELGREDEARAAFDEYVDASARGAALRMRST